MRRVVAVALVLSACSGGLPATGGSTSSVGVSVVATREYAASAQRALEGTAFEALGIEAVANTIGLLCDGFGRGAIPAVIDGLGITAPTSDREILTEVLDVGMRQVCPDRAAVDLSAVYLDAVSTSADSAGAGDALDEAAVLRAGLAVCPALDSSGGVEGALLVVVEELFGGGFTEVDELAGRLDAAQGVVAGSTLAAATALLCPSRISEVTAFVESL